MSAGAWLDRAVLSALFLGSLTARAQATCDPDGVQASGAIYRICMPEPQHWNGDLVVWAHGYVAEGEPLAIPEDQLRLPDGTAIPDLVNALGFAFATTSYSTNGLAIPQGLADVVDLVQLFESAKGPVDKVYLIGASEGGLIATLGLERHADIFSGGLAACGPIGSFPAQINYFGDFRVVFDYFYPRLLPGDVFGVPDWLVQNWPAYYDNVVKPTLFAPKNLPKTLQLARVTHLPFVSSDFWPSIEGSVKDVLWYNVFATNDAMFKLGGQPFDNSKRLYFGSRNDFLLNLFVRRVTADPAALGEMAARYETSGALGRPLVTLHTVLDPQVPFWHEWLYLFKAWNAGSLLQLVVVPVDRYGHCNFTAIEVLISFGILVFKVEGTPLRGVDQVLKDPEAQAEFAKLARQRGLSVSAR